MSFSAKTLLHGNFPKVNSGILLLCSEACSQALATVLPHSAGHWLDTRPSPGLSIDGGYSKVTILFAAFESGTDQCIAEVGPPPGWECWDKDFAVHCL